MLSLEIEHNKTNQKISNYDGVSLVISNVSNCARHTADDMNWEVAQKPQDRFLLSLLCFMMSGVRRSCDLETFLVPGSVLMNTPLGVIGVYFSAIAYLLCVLKIFKIS